MSLGYFKERSRYPVWIVLAITFSVLGLLYFFTEKTEKGTEDIVYSFIVIGMVAVLFLFISLRLRVDNEGIKFSFLPFVWNSKVIRWEELNKVSIRKSNPLKEFGGWGFRIKYKNKAYTLFGKWGLDLQFKNGKSLFIGVQKHEELSQLMDSVIYPLHPQLKEGKRI